MENVMTVKHKENFKREIESTHHTPKKNSKLLQSIEIDLIHLGKEDVWVSAVLWPYDYF